MYWFLLVYVAIALLSLSDLAPRSQRTLPAILIWLLLAMTAGFRNMGGSDYLFYELHYCSDQIFVDYFEPGYCACVWLCNGLGIGYNMFIALLSSVSLWLLMRFFRHRSEYPMMSMVLYAGLYFFYYNLVLMRQMVAVVAFMYALGYMIDGKNWRFVWAVLLGALFHYSILVLIPAYFFIRYFRVNLFGILLLATGALAFRMLGAMFLVDTLNDAGLAFLASRADGYMAGAQSGGYTVNPIEFVKVAVMVPLIWVMYGRIREAPGGEMLVKCYLIYIATLIAFYNIEVLFRVSMYFDLALTLLVPLIVSRIHMQKAPVLLAVGALAVFSILYRIHHFGGGHFLDYKFFFLQ